MHDVPILTRELAQHLERLVAPEPTADSDPPDPTVPVVTQFGQTIASKAKAGAPSNKVFLFNEADIPLLPQILEFYRVDDLEPSFYLSPLTYSAAVGAVLRSAGFAMRDFQQAILYGAPTSQAAHFPPGVTVEPVTAANLAEFAQTMSDGFEWDPSWRDYAIRDTIRKFDPTKLSFLARCDGEAAGVATLGRAGTVGKIAGGAVVPKHRGKGIHLALVRYRAHLAASVGCNLLSGGADYGSVSFRNQLRAGMRLAYVESGWFRV